MSRPTRAVINTAALRANLQQVRAYAPTQRVIAVIKANAYGHGAVRVARALESQTDAFAVTCLEEALELREADIKKPIILLEGFFSADELPIIAQHQLQIILHTVTQVQQLLETSLASSIHVWLKVDTGMHRLGFAPDEMTAIYQRLQQCPHILPPIRLMSHLACADDQHNPTTDIQTQTFTSLVQNFKTEASLANSAGILGWPQTHADWVRPGIMLYGVSPFIDSVGKKQGLQPVMELQSELISIQRCRQGDPIGYGGTWRCPRSTLIGIIAIGYADGYPRHAPSGTPVLVKSKRVPLVGRVSMDMIAVDLRNQPNARIGDPVILWGKNLPVEEIAYLSGTIAYELLCHINSRVTTVYL